MWTQVRTNWNSWGIWRKKTWTIQKYPHLGHGRFTLELNDSSRKAKTRNRLMQGIARMISARIPCCNNGFKIQRTIFPQIFHILNGYIVRNVIKFWRVGYIVGQVGSSSFLRLPLRVVAREWRNDYKVLDETVSWGSCYLLHVQIGTSVFSRFMRNRREFGSCGIDGSRLAQGVWSSSHGCGLMGWVWWDRTRSAVQYVCMESKGF